MTDPKQSDTGRVPPEHVPYSRIAAFALVFLALQWWWSGQAGGATYRIWIETLNVGGAVELIDLIRPSALALADGSRIRAPGGGLNVLQGCDGAELLWLTTAAFAVAPLAWRWRVAGWLSGLLLAYGLNVARIVALFFAFRTDARLFDWLHNYVGPLALMGLIALHFHFWLRSAPAPTVDETF